MRRVAVAVVFLTLLSGVVVGAHLYIVQRLVDEPGLPEPWRGWAVAAVVLLAASLVLQPISERLLRPRVSRLLAWPAALWMGFAFLLLILLAATDLILGLGGAAAWAAGAEAPDPVAAARTRAGAVLLVALLAGAAGMRGALRPPRVRRVEILLARWPRVLDGLRIVQISDIHIGPLLDGAFARALTERVNALQPDLVAVTGDLVDGSVRSVGDQVEPFADLRARHGVFFVTGNHDHYSGARSWVGRVQELGMRPLRNEHVAIEHGDGVFDLAGVDDHHGSWVSPDGGEDLDAALSERDPARACVLLAHDPSTFKRAAGRVDLQLSGHTHGGQIWPFKYLVKLAVPFVAGLYERDGSRLYVSCGTGFWGPPMRIGAPAEITEITLRAGAEA
jgi:predicted MPP superfamily phosphohydrolase